MKSKIEIGKLGRIGQVSQGKKDRWYIDNLNNIIEKQNEIIDYLNTQPQAEEDWYCECGEPANQGEHICKQSTPEQKEDWEDRFNRYWGCMFECGDYENLIRDIENLLSERDKRIEELEEWINSDLGVWVESKLDKLKQPKE